MRWDGETGRWERRIKFTALLTHSDGHTESRHTNHEADVKQQQGRRCILKWRRRRDEDGDQRVNLILISLKPEKRETAGGADQKMEIQEDGKS